MSSGAITWYLKASKINIDTSNNYGNYDQFDECYLISPAIIDDILECLNSMNYDIINYKFINHHEHCAKWCIVFETDDSTDDYSEFRKHNFEKIKKFKSGLFTTSSIYARYISDDDDDDDSDDSTDDEQDGWFKIFSCK